jgi:hypothetical protein
MVTYMSTNRPNKFRGTCATCGCAVAANAGFLGSKVNGRWTTKCAAHGTPARATRSWDDDDGFDAMKDARCEAGTWRR